MSVGAVVYNDANTGSAIASTNITSGGYSHGLLDATVSNPLNKDTEIAIEVHRGHPSTSAFTVGRIVRITDDNGEVTKFEIEKIDDHKIAGDPSSETLRVSGRTLLGQWRNSIMRAHADYGPMSKSIAFNFAYPGLDVSAWTDSVVDVDRTSFGFIRPIGWADPYTYGVWSSTQTVGSLFGRRQFTLGSPGRYVGYASGDDGFSIWLNGIRLGEKFAKLPDLEPVYWRPWRSFMVDLPAGTHTLAVEGRNLAGIGTLWASVWPTNGSFLGPGPPVLLTGPSSMSANPAVGDWDWIAYPGTRPAPPITRAIHDFVTRNQTDGGMSGWTLGFTSTKDSNSATPPALEWVSDLRKTGYDMLESFSGAGWLDFQVRKGAGKVLDCFVAPGGADSGITYGDMHLGDMRKQVVL